MRATCENKAKIVLTLDSNNKDLFTSADNAKENGFVWNAEEIFAGK
jgi:hypothetical protein